MPRIVVAIIALAILAMVGAAAFQAGLEDAGEDIDAVNETWVPDAGNITTLNDSNISAAYYDNDTVVYDENDTEMERGTDYEWFTGNGTVLAVVGGGLDGDSEALISYGYQRPTKVQRDMATLLANIPKVIGLALPLFVLVLFMVFARG